MPTTTGRSLHAWESRDLTALRILASDGVSANTRDGGSRFSTPGLTHAATSGHKAAVEFPLDSGADVNADNSTRTIALMLASLNGYVGVVRLLVAHEGDVFAVNEDDKTAVALLEAAGATGKGAFD